MFEKDKTNNIIITISNDFVLDRSYLRITEQEFTMLPIDVSTFFSHPQIYNFTFTYMHLQFVFLQERISRLKIR